MCTPVFTAAMTTITKKRKQPKRPAADKRVNEICSILLLFSREVCPALCDLQATRLLCPWDFPGKNTGVGGHLLLQGVFLGQGSNPHLLHWQADSLLLSHLGSRALQTYKEMVLRPKNKEMRHTLQHSWPLINKPDAAGQMLPGSTYM